ncbi:hypothetical protein [Xenorhabdus doucetiae]|nr:hypothetical protein [Xenorhabdus doucetiae]
MAYSRSGLALPINPFFPFLEKQLFADFCQGFLHAIPMFGDTGKA